MEELDEDVSKVELVEESPPKQVGWKMRLWRGFCLAVGVAFIIMLIGGTIAMSHASNQEARLQKQYPITQLHLSDFMTAAGLTYRSSMPVTFSPLTTVSQLSLHGGGFTILGTGNNSLSGSSSPSLVRIITWRAGDKQYSAMVPGSQGIIIDNSLHHAEIRLPNPKLDTYRPFVSCSAAFFPPYRHHCSVDRSGDYKTGKFNPDLLDPIKQGGMTYVLQRYHAKLVAPQSAIP